MSTWPQSQGEWRLCGCVVSTNVRAVMLIGAQCAGSCADWSRDDDSCWDGLEWMVIGHSIQVVVNPPVAERPGYS